MPSHISDEKRRQIDQDILDGYRTNDIVRRQSTTKETVRARREKLEFQEGAPDGFSVNATSTLIDAGGKVIQRWVKAKKDPVEDTLDVIRTAFDEYRGRASIVPAPKKAKDADLLTVYNIADHHLGLYAWAAETGADYDLAIGERVLLDAMGALVKQAPHSETAIILQLGDFLHADNSENRTLRSGNSLDVDSRYAKVLQVGVKLLIAATTQALLKHSKVIVRNLPGNHDPHSALALSIALSCFFDGNPRVTVDLDPSKFFFHQFGKVMIAATHGDTVKLAKFPGVMAAYQPVMWGQTSYRYGYTGHIHHQRSVEENGATCEAFRTLAGKDAYHHAGGYSSGRGMVAITHHKERGEFIRHTVTANLEAA
jgi:hypothetical protein